MLRVDRRKFVPEQAAHEAYVDAPVILKVGRDGRPSSTASQPTMVAVMLEQLGPKPGHRVLEVGTASGYNAALLSHLVGDGGHVVTIEIDRELATLAAGRLQHLHNIDVVVGDGRVGCATAAPFNGIIVTAGAPEVAPAWIDQLVPGGTLVVPITTADGHGQCITYERSGDELVELWRVPCGFVPLRGEDG